MRKTIIALLLVLSSGNPNAGQNRLDEEAVRIRTCVLFFAVDEPAIRAGLRLENGPPGKEFGYETKNNLAVFGIACLPAGSGQFAQFSQAWIRAIQAFVLRDEYTRRNFFRYFSWYYHRGGPGRNDEEKDRNNADYAKQLHQIWREERAFLRQTRSRTGYQPLILSDEEKP